MKNDIFLKVLYSLAKEAGNIMIRFRGFPDERKSDGTPVTIADKIINELVIQRMKKDFPYMSVIAEEGSRMSGSETYAFCDPIDGTESFCKRRNLSAFSMAIVRDGIAVAAIISNPFTGQTWSAEKGRGCFMNGHRVRVSPRPVVDKSSFYVMWWQGKSTLSFFNEELLDRGASTLTEGSIVYPAGLVASGLFEGTIFPGNKSWEAAAMDRIVTEAGGRFTDLYGRNITYPCREDGCFEGDGHIASNGILHPALLDLVSLCL